MRSYDFLLYNSEETHQEMQYCPWCGKKLPKTLGSEWDDYLKKEHNLSVDDFWNKNGDWDESKIPEEFRTDKWWKKRGL